MMMYQLPIDMMTRIASVILATRSPPFHSASRPYGLSTTSGSALAAAAVRRGGARRRSGRQARPARRVPPRGPAFAPAPPAARRPRRSRAAGPRPARPDGSSSTCCLQTMVTHRNEGFRTDAFGRLERQRDGPRRQPDKPPVIDRLLGFGGTCLRTPAEPTPEPCDCGADRRLTHTPNTLAPLRVGPVRRKTAGFYTKAPKNPPRN